MLTAFIVCVLVVSQIGFVYVMTSSMMRIVNYDHNDKAGLAFDVCLYLSGCVFTVYNATVFQCVIS
jgi:hypothetical protein